MPELARSTLPLPDSRPQLYLRCYRAAAEMDTSHSRYLRLLFQVGVVSGVVETTGETWTSGGIEEVDLTTVRDAWARRQKMQKG